MRISEVREQESVTRLQEEWQTLQAKCPDATPFQTWEWNSLWWKHYGARKRVCVLLFRAGHNGELVGIAPLYTSWHLGIPLRRLAWMGTGTSDYHDILVLPEYAEEVTTAFLNYLSERLGGWDMADLQQIRPDSPLMTHAPCPWPHRPEEAQSLLPMEPCPFVALPDNWNDFALSLGKKMRSNLNYYERLLFKTFPDARFYLADAYTLQEGMTALFDLHQQRWNARWLPGVLGSKRVQTFHRAISEQMLERGWLRLHLLEIGGRCCAALYCFALNGRTYYYLGGFLPELSKYSLGTLLTARAIQQSITEDCTEFDFLRGREPYKYKWTSEERMNSRLLLLRSREHLGSLGALPGRAGLALNRVERYVVHQAKAFAEQQGRKGRSPLKENTETKMQETLSGVASVSTRDKNP